MMGLEIYNSNGEIILNTDSLTTRVLGTGNTGEVDGSITDANINNQSVWVAITGYNSYVDEGSEDVPSLPAFISEGNVLRWEFGEKAADYAVYVGCSFMYGVF